MGIIGWLCVGLFAAGYYPLALAWRGSRGTTLLDTMNWTLTAWTAWVGAVAEASVQTNTTALRYVAICLSGCATIAVLGARRPGVTAWNWVIVGLLGVTLLPLAESWFAGGSFQLAGFRMFFLGSIVAVGVINYLPTRLGPAALCWGLGCGTQLMMIGEPHVFFRPPSAIMSAGLWLLALSPWVGLVCYRGGDVGASELDRQWLEFRDRFGLIWAQRLREQFNRAAANAGWPLFLYWRGFRVALAASKSEAPDLTVVLATLRALMKRFERVDQEPGPPPMGPPK